jgi:hypothetical protein
MFILKTDDFLRASRRHCRGFLATLGTFENAGRVPSTAASTTPSRLTSDSRFDGAFEAGSPCGDI